MKATNLLRMCYGCNGLSLLETGDNFKNTLGWRATLPKAMTMDGATAMASDKDLPDGAHTYTA